MSSDSAVPSSSGPEKPIQPLHPNPVKESLSRTISRAGREVSGRLASQNCSFPFPFSFHLKRIDIPLTCCCCHRPKRSSNASPASSTSSKCHIVVPCLRSTWSEDPEMRQRQLRCLLVVLLLLFSLIAIATAVIISTSDLTKKGLQDCSAYNDCCYYVTPPYKATPSAPLSPSDLSRIEKYKARECHNLYMSLQTRLEKAERFNDGKGGVVMRLESSWGGLLWEGAAGRVSRDDYRAVEAPPPITPSSPFELASLSKLITTALVLVMCEKKMMSLMDPITKYLPNSITDNLLVVQGKDYTSDLKIWHLLSHRGGLADFWRNINFVTEFSRNSRRFWYPTETIEYAKQLKGIFVPQSSMRGRFFYSDTGFVLMGLIIERVAQKPLHTMLRTWLFEPLAMPSCYLSFREEAATSEREAHRYEGEEDLHGRRRQSADWASGGIVCNAKDVSRFLRFFFENDITREKTMTLIKGVGPTYGYFSGSNFISYSLGTMRLRLKNLGNLWGHDGYGNTFGFYWEEMGIVMCGTLNQLKNDWLARSVSMLADVKKFLEKKPPQGSTFFDVSQGDGGAVGEGDFSSEGVIPSIPSGGGVEGDQGNATTRGSLTPDRSNDGQGSEQVTRATVVSSASSSNQQDIASPPSRTSSETPVAADSDIAASEEGWT